MENSGPRSSLNKWNKHDEQMKKVTASNLPAIHQATSTSPIQLEDARAVGNCTSVQVQGFLRRLRSRELDETVSSVAKL